MNSFLLILLLIVVTLLIVFALKKQGEFQKKITKAMQESFSELNSEKEMNQEIDYLKNQEKGHLKEINKLNAEKSKLKRLINTDPNIGEEITIKHLNDIFLNFKENKQIDNYTIINNIYIHDVEYERQIDHVVICDYGIYVIETKHWQGDIFYNVAKEDISNGKNAFLIRYFFEENPDKRQTFVIKKDENVGLAAKRYGDPIKQLWGCISLVRKVLNTDIFINGIVYFNHNSNKEDNFLNGTKHEKGLIAVTNKDELQIKIKERIKKSGHKRLNEEEINQLSKKLLKYNFDDSRNYELRAIN